MKQISIQGIFLFICALFAFQSCSKKLLLSGTVTSADNGQRIKGIKVSMIKPSLLYASDTFYKTEGWDHVITNNKGEFSFDVWYETSYGWVFFEDIDSMENGFYKNKSVRIGITSQNEIEVNIKLDKVK
ncbi:MAG: hypothetical protein LBG17_00520 [Bacteroidales bacterium]|jgi:hypothetical protein|nr:hypothetical protein [Bacteroidales bacterium]